MASLVTPLEIVNLMLVLTPEMLERAYEYLRSTKPFSGWNLPDGEDVVFRVARTKTDHGWHTGERRGRKVKHTIAASSGLIGRTNHLMKVLAHEMVHMHMVHSRITEKNHHGRAFHKFAAQVCKHHDFDPKLF